MNGYGHRLATFILCILLSWTQASAHDLNLVRIEFESLGELSHQFTVWISPPPGRVPALPIVPDNTELTQSEMIGTGGDLFRFELSGELDPDSRILLPWNHARAYFVFEDEQGNQREQFLETDSKGIHLPWSLMTSEATHSESLGFLILGFEHIAYGFDHLLFVLGLLLLVREVRELIATITAFTIAHSITLALVIFDVVSISSEVVEPLIALSIVFLAVEVVRAQQDRAGFTGLHPWIAAFAFGLLHGLGFASAVGELGVPAEDIPLTLLVFNIGIELGQLGFVLLFLILGWSFRQLEVQWPSWALPIPAYAIGVVSTFWFFERTCDAPFLL